MANTEDASSEIFSMDTPDKFFASLSILGILQEWGRAGREGVSLVGAASRFVAAVHVHGGVWHSTLVEYYRGEDGELLWDELDGEDGHATKQDAWDAALESFDWICGTVAITSDQVILRLVAP